MKSGAALWVLALLGVVVMGAAVQQSNARKPKNIERDLSKLHPAFRRKVEQLISAMQSDGYRPLVWESYRSPERAAELQADGSGKAKSQHSLGLAVDIVDAVKRWDAGAGFWASLHKHALALGLSRVKHRDVNGNLSWDKPHVQALPGTMDARLFKLAGVDRDALVSKRLA